MKQLGLVVRRYVLTVWFMEVDTFGLDRVTAIDVNYFYSGIVKRRPGGRWLARIH